MISRLRAPILVLSLLALAICSPARIDGARPSQSLTKTQLSALKLRVLINDFVPSFSDQVEEAADRIIAARPGPAFERNAILWKSHAISAAFQAASRNDAIAAYLDLWILCRQMALFFESQSPPALGPWQGLAVQTSRQLEAQAQRIDDDLGSPLPAGEKFVADFAREFPIRSLYFDRESLAQRYIQTVDEPTRDSLHVVANLNESLREMHQLAARYAELLPKQARWQAELTLLATTERSFVTQPLREFSQATQAVERVARVVDSAPELVARERQAVGELAARERAEILHELERMRVRTMEQLAVERETLLAALRDERVATTEALASVTDKSIERVDAIVARRATQAAQASGKFLERLVLRVSLVVGIAALAVWLLSRRSGTPPTAHSDALPEREPLPIRPKRRAA